MRAMNTINLISENQANSSATLALSLVRAICHQKDVFNVQITRSGEEARIVSFKLDYKAPFKTNLNRLLLDISKCTLSKEGYSIRVVEPQESNAAERQIVRLMNSATLDEFLTAEPGHASQSQAPRFSSSTPTLSSAA